MKDDAPLSAELRALVAVARRDAPPKAGVARLTAHLFSSGGAPPPHGLSASPLHLVLLGATAMAGAGFLAIQVSRTAPTPLTPRHIAVPSMAATFFEDGARAATPSASGAEAVALPTPAEVPSMTPRTTPHAAPAASPRAPRSSELPPRETEGDAEMLARAMRYLDARPAEALAVTRLHEARFPRSALGQERERIAIAALVATGNRELARQRADRFLLAFPGSAYAARIRRLVGLEAKSEAGQP